MLERSRRDVDSEVVWRGSLATTGRTTTGVSYETFWTSPVWGSIDELVDSSDEIVSSFSAGGAGIETRVGATAGRIVGAVLDGGVGSVAGGSGRETGGGTAGTETSGRSGRLAVRVPREGVG